MEKKWKIPNRLGINYSENRLFTRQKIRRTHIFHKLVFSKGVFYNDGIYISVNYK